MTEDTEMTHRCRGCDASLDHLLIDLGPAPLANAFVDGLDAPETFYPLRAFVCERCFLVQIPEVETPGSIFNENYAYFSSSNPPFVEHARKFVDETVKRLDLGPQSRVFEIASNDGYLLQHFLPYGIPVLGIEPSGNVAAVARDKGIPTATEFFGSHSIFERGTADLIVANNVLAHVPNLHDFMEGMAACLKPTGWISIEFPHVVNMLNNCQFDTIYHEHYSYFSLRALQPIVQAHGLEIVHVERFPVHGGSLRVWLRHRSLLDVPTLDVANAMSFELHCGIDQIATYDKFAADAMECRHKALDFFLTVGGKSIAGYGAAAKGNTFLNWCGIRRDLLPWVADSTAYKVGKYLPGSRIPVVAEELLASSDLEFLVILPWNWREALAKRATELGFRGQFVTMVPEPAVGRYREPVAI
jgi:SAM-dependent methyltransferase